MKTALKKNELKMPSSPPPKPSALNANDPCEASMIYDQTHLSVDRRQGVIMAIDACRRHPNSIETARVSTLAKLQERAAACNWQVWGYAGTFPTANAEQIAELRVKAAQPAHHEYRHNALEAAALRYLLEGIESVDKELEAEWRRKNERALAAAQDKALRDDFEAEERAASDRRFADWKAKRKG